MTSDQCRETWDEIDGRFFGQRCERPATPCPSAEVTAGSPCPELGTSFQSRPKMSHF